MREKNAIATQIEISNATKETRNLDVLLANDLTALVSQDNFETEFDPEIEIYNNLFAPIAKGKVVGKITYNIDGIDYSSDLIASHDVKLSSFWTLTIQIILVVLILFILYKLLFENDYKKKIID